MTFWTIWPLTAMHNINIYYTGISLIRNLCCLNVLSDRTAEHQLNHVNSLFKRLCCRKPFIRLVDIGIWPICISIWKSYSSNGHIVSKQNIAYLSNNQKLICLVWQITKPEVLHTFVLFKFNSNGRRYSLHYCFVYLQ
jgi:hypothetical protein